MSPQTIAAAAIDYARRGWKPVPIGRKSKKPIGEGWQKRPFDPAQFNGNAQNIAIQLGAVSHGLADVDLDCMDAIGFATDFLPATGAIFGRRSKPSSHQLYTTDLHQTEQAAVIAYAESTGGKAGQMIVELRIGANGKGATSVFPPSLHVTGESVEWVDDGEPAHVSGADLKRAVAQLAVACLLKRHYPGEGSRHEGALVIGGVLARAGWTADDITHVIRIVARAVGDSEVSDRVNTAASAVKTKANGEDVAGPARAADVWGKDAADTLAKWLRADAPRQAKGGQEDSIALAFAEQHAGDYRYVAASRQWMRWRASCWRPEQTLAAFDSARTLCRRAGDAQAKTVAAVERLAKTDRRIAATAEQFDASRTLFNMPDHGGKS
jgi:bifunctional DNA primase/polymerase-like protein/D5-like protein